MEKPCCSFYSDESQHVVCWELYGKSSVLLPGSFFHAFRRTLFTSQNVRFRCRKLVFPFSCTDPFESKQTLIKLFRLIPKKKKPKNSLVLQLVRLNFLLLGHVYWRGCKACYKCQLKCINTVSNHRISICFGQSLTIFPHGLRCSYFISSIKVNQSTNI